MFCIKCGNEVEKGEKFCGYCGNKIEPIVPAQPQMGFTKPEKALKERNLLIPIIIGGVIILLVVIIGVVALFSGRNNNESNEDFSHSDITESTIETEVSSETSTTETTITTTESTTKKETTTAKSTTTKPAASSVYLEATSTELNQLADFLGIVGSTTGPLCSNYDSKNISYKHFVENYLFHTSGYSFTYNKYFKVTTYYYDETPDPLNRFMAVDYEWKTGQYYKYSKSNIEWIMKNIYNIPSSTISSFSASSIEDDDTYYKDGYIYQEEHVGFGSSGLYIEVDKYTRLNDGRYSVHFREMNEFSGETEGTATAIVSMKNIDGKRYWTLHSIEP